MRHTDVKSVLHLNRGKQCTLLTANSLHNITCKSQLDEYMQEVKVKGCPGAWWNLNKTKYPAIAKLAKKYLAVQGTSTPAERVMSDMGTILNKKRLAMSDENFRMLMYLGDI